MCTVDTYRSTISTIHYLTPAVCLQVISTCHQMRVVHGDVKPANFLLRQPLVSNSPCALSDMAQEGTFLRAIDFGCSQFLKPDKPLCKRYLPCPPILNSKLSRDWRQSQHVAAQYLCRLAWSAQYLCQTVWQGCAHLSFSMHQVFQ